VKAAHELEWFSDEAKSSFMLSLSLHFMLLLIGYIAQRWSVSPTNTFLNDQQKLIQSSVRVDVVGMPKMTLQELRELQLAAQGKETTAPSLESDSQSDDIENKSNIEDIQTQNKLAKSKFLNLVQNLSEKKTITGSQTQSSRTARNKLDLSQLVLEGNKLSKGSALVGEVSAEAVSDFTAYVQSLPDLVRQNWRLPDYLRNKNYRCRIRVWIGSQGQLLKSQIVESSGVDDFDLRAERAIKSSTPFPVPSVEVAKMLAAQGVVLAFPL
jgi:colicin import membrane protein